MPDPSEVRVLVNTVRGPARPIALGIAVTTLIVWLASFVPFTYATATGRAALERSGFMPLLGSWVLVSLIIAVGYGAGYAVMRAVAPAHTQVKQRRLLRLAGGDAFFAMVGGVASGFFPVSLMPNLFTMFAWTLVVGMLFSFVVINPRYVSRFRRAVEDGDIVRDYND